MSLQVAIQSIKPQPAAAIEFTTPMSQIGRQMGRVFGEVMGYLQSVGAHPTGPPFASYPDMQPDNQGDWRVVSGFPVVQTIKGQGRVQPYVLAGGAKVAVTTHVGPYDTIERTYNALQEWMKQNNFESAGTMWESYLTDPAEEPDQSKWRTMIYWPVKSN